MRKDNYTCQAFKFVTVGICRRDQAKKGLAIKLVEESLNAPSRVFLCHVFDTKVWHFIRKQCRFTKGNEERRYKPYIVLLHVTRYV